MLTRRCFLRGSAALAGVGLGGPKLIADGSDWRFLTELRRELKG